MNVVVDGQTKRKVVAGDVIEYEHTSHRNHGFYMICESKMDGFFIISLTGQKSKLKFYDSAEELLEVQRGIARIYPKKEWEMRLTKLPQ